MSSNQPLGPFAPGERVGAFVWLAEDTRSGKPVAVKVLSKQLPKDPGRREQMIRDLRVAAALYHTFLVPILEIAATDDTLYMVMERVDGAPLTRFLGGKPRGREELFRLGHQLGSAVKYLHTRNILHGNINGDSVLVTADGQIRLAGLNLANLIRREKVSTSYQQKGSDARVVAYMAPEQISSQSIDERSDIFSIGVVLYEIATGRTPFGGTTAAEIARAIVEGQPMSPKALNPEIDNSVLSVLGGCLFKDPFKRLRDAKQLVETIERLDPAAGELTSQLEKRATIAVPAPSSSSRRSILLIADLAEYDAILAHDPDEASRDVDRMQQVLGEAVYLFDGKVVDPFSTRVVAELPTVESALEAGRKAEFDFGPDQSRPMKVRMMLHAGEVALTDGVPGGPAIDRAFETLAHLAPNTLFISEEFVKEGRGGLRMRDVGARAGMKLYTIVPPEPAVVLETEVSSPTADAAEEAAEVAALDAAMRQAARRRALRFAGAGALVLLVAAAVGGWMWTHRGKERPEPKAAAVARVPQRPTAEHPQEVYIAPFAVEGADPALSDRAEAVRLASIEVLRSIPEIRVVDAPRSGAPTFSGRLRTGPAGPELVPTSGVVTGTPVALLDSASGVRSFVGWVSTQSKVEPRTYAVADALNSFTDAVVARSRKDDSRADASLRAALTSDPNLLPAQLLAMRYFSDRGDVAAATAAAKQVVAIDPSNLTAARSVARASLAGGDLPEMFAMYALVLRRIPNDVEALNVIGRYAVSAGDTAHFNSALARLKRTGSREIAVHEPDLVAAAGRLGVAADRYYDLTVGKPSNAALSLKIGRLSVLRHSVPLADDELGKLASADPLYGFHMLRAYIAAEKRNRAEAEGELKIALGVATPGDDSSTSAAEVYAILADSRGVLASLEKAALRKEPTAAYILANPLFRYLENEPRFGKVREMLTAQQEEVRASLAGLQL